MPTRCHCCRVCVRHYGQPFADSSAIPTFHVSRMARQFVKMVLSGDGGDENFAGYNSYEYVISRLNDARSPVSARASATGSATWRRSRCGACGVPSSPSRSSTSSTSLQSITAQHFPPAARRDPWRREHRHLVQDVDQDRRALLDIARAPVVTRLQHLDLMAYLPFDILTKVDIAAMANSLEVRVPLLDHHVVELAATMPSELKLAPVAGGGFEKKAALKRLAARRYPASILDRPKMGFRVPIGDWMARQLRGEVEQRLLHSTMLPSFFDMTTIAGIWQRHVSHGDMTARVWNLLFLEEWLRTHQDAVPAHASR